MDINKIRNFCIIAHIDHGKSTLADRFLELTGTITERERKDQILDSMDLERERGITIKMQPVTMEWKGYTLNLIDTPGHVDFTYEVSRALAAVEGAILLVDATQGIQAQTLANLYLAMEQDIMIIPVINKIDLPAADPEAAKAELASLLGQDPRDVIAVSAKTGQNVELILERIIERLPHPQHHSDKDESSMNLIFDSYYDKHRGVICDIRAFQGQIKTGDQIVFYQTNTSADVKEVGIYTPKQKSVDTLGSGQIGYLVTGIRDVNKCHVGDTIIKARSKREKVEAGLKSVFTPLSGYKAVKPVVFANIYSKDQSRFLDLRKALEELNLNDASLIFDPVSTTALGQGFKIGVLGLLHLDIIKERIKREYGVELILTVPQVEYRIKMSNAKIQMSKVITSAQEFPENTSQIEEIQEPWVKLEVVTPEKYIGDIMRLVMERRGSYVNTEYLKQESHIPSRAIMHFNLPLAELLTDFYDKLKSVSSGYGSLSYDLSKFKAVDLVKIDFLGAGEVREALSQLIPKKEAYHRACGILSALKKEIPSHMFEVRLQAKLGGKIIASERVRALRKNVTAGLYGGDVSRKMKVLKKQKKGKKKMREMGTVEIPTKAYLAVLKR